MSIVLDDHPRVETRSEPIAASHLSPPNRPTTTGKLISAARNPLALLGCITLLGGVLRSVALDQPALWGDEAFTFSRVCGTYRQMLDVLQANGFMPLIYSLYWWIGQHVDLSPIVMRLPVAIAGTLMPPAMYFLSRQLRLPTTTSLVVALFAACSAYMLVYSRDAKMYMPFFLACATYVGCVLWWIHGMDSARPGTAPPGFRYICAIAAGVAMCGMHALGAAVIGVSLLMVAASPAARWGSVGRLMLIPPAAAWGAIAWALQRVRMPWFRHRSSFFAPTRRLAAGLRVPGILLFFLAAAVPLLATKLYFDHFTRWDDRVGDDWNASGIQWVQFYNAERDGPGLVIYAATAFLMSWEWPAKSWKPLIDPRALKLLTVAAVIFAAAALLGIWPWRRRNDDERRGGRTSDSHEPAFGQAPALPTQRPGNFAIPHFALPLFCVLCWLTLPTYAVYCRSIQPFAAPWEPLATAAEWMGSSPWAGGIAGLALILSFWRVAPTWKRRFIIAGTLALIVGAVFALLCVEYQVMSHAWKAAQAAGDRWWSVWMPRYVGLVWPAFAIALVVLLMRLPTRPLRAAVIALLLGVNLIQFALRVWGGSEPPTDKLAEDIVAAQPLFVRQQLLTADIVQQTMRLADRLPTRLSRIGEQVAKLPLTEPRLRVYVQTGVPSPEPGGGVIGSFPARYYLTWRSGAETDPAQFRQWRSPIDRTWTFPIGLSPRPIAEEMRKNPQYDRLVTWDRINRNQRDVNYDDPVIRALGSGWKRASQQLFPARDHWTWRRLYDLRRREYVRVAPATHPAK